MSPALQEFIWNITKSHLTKGISFVAGWLVLREIIPQDSFDTFVGLVSDWVFGITLAVLSSALTIWNRYKDTIKLAIAARMPGGVTIPEVKAEAARNTTPLKALIVLLAVGVTATAAPACGKRYAPGTPLQNKFAYELEQGLGIVLDTQTKVIAAVDSGATTKAIADRFLIPARELAELSKTRIIPTLKAYDSAVTAGDLNAQKLLTAELTPLMREFNRLSGAAFGASLPDNVVGSLGKLLQQLQSTIRTVLQEFTPDAVPASAAL